MSRRQIKKFFGNRSLNIENASSDSEDETPSFGQERNQKNPFSLLDLPSSESETEEVSSSPSTSKCDTNVKKKKEGKQKNKQIDKSKSKPDSQEEDIDEIVREVNALLGEPEPIPVVPVEEVILNKDGKILAINQKHLNGVTEFDRRFGPEEQILKRKKPHDPVRVFIKNQIAPHVHNTKNKGLSMSIDHKQLGFTYYWYTHSLVYQEWQRDLISIIKLGAQFRIGLPPAAINTMHVEGLLQSFVIMCATEDYTSAIKILERAIAYLQHVAHPLFNISHPGTKLAYLILENRPFHIAVLLYSHIISNMACHRTALELAKMLLNLDNSDPLAVILVIDTFAIRAREFEWLITAVEWLDSERNAKSMFNIAYSNALAHFHVAHKNSGDMAAADDLLKQVVATFPIALRAIVEAAQPYNTPISVEILAHPLFSAEAAARTPVALYGLMKLYGAFLSSCWKEVAVLKWLFRNAKEFIEKYDSDPELQIIPDTGKVITPVLQRLMAGGARNQIDSTVRQNICRAAYFRTWPIEVYRHLCLITPISDLLVDGAVPEVPGYHSVRVFDPAPRATVNRYRYEK